MPQFTWTGRDARHDVRTGIIEAPSARQAAQVLSTLALAPDVILPFPPLMQKAPAGPVRRTGPGSCAGHVQDMAVQARALLRSGVAKERVFTALSSSVADPGLTEVLQRMGQQVGNGAALWEAMDGHPAYFDAFSVALVRQAEHDERLADGFRHVELHMEFSCSMRARTVDAASRPSELAVSFAALLALGLLGLVPAAKATFLAERADLPWLTQVLLDTSARLAASVPTLLAVAGALWGLVFVARRLRGPLAGPLRRWDRLRLHEPLAGPTLRSGAAAQLAGCLALGQRVGLALPLNLELASSQFDNEQLRASTLALKDLVSQGASLGDAFGVEGWLDEQTRRRLHDAQSQGALGPALAELTRQCRGQTESAWARLERRYRRAVVVGSVALALPILMGLLLPLLG